MMENQVPFLWILRTLDKILIAAHNVEMVEFVKDEESVGGNHDES
jgi:hypothetical protein